MSAGERWRANDERLLEVLTRLDAGEWAAPSLCTEWSNHQVLAHLVVGYGCGVAEFASTLVRHRRFEGAQLPDPYGRVRISR